MKKHTASWWIVSTAASAQRPEVRRIDTGIFYAEDLLIRKACHGGGGSSGDHCTDFEGCRRRWRGRGKNKRYLRVDGLRWNVRNHAKTAEKKQFKTVQRNTIRRANDDEPAVTRALPCFRRPLTQQSRDLPAGRHSESRARRLVCAFARRP